MVLDELLKYKGQPGFEYLDNFGHGTKKCSRCKEVKDKGLFNKKKSTKDGLFAQCRECDNELKKERRRKNRERNEGKPKDPDYHKTCPKCGVTKSSVDFSRNRSSKDGLSAQCKDCSKKRLQAFYEDNPDYRRKHRERERMQREMIRAVATVSGRYSPEEDLVVLDDTLTEYQKAVKLRRTFRSVRKRKATLKKKGITHVTNYPKV